MAIAFYAKKQYNFVIANCEAPKKGFCMPEEKDPKLVKDIFNETVPEMATCPECTNKPCQKHAETLMQGLGDARFLSEMQRQSRE